MLNDYLNEEKSNDKLAVPVLLELDDLLEFAEDLDQLIDSGKLEELIKLDPAPVEYILKNAIRVALYAAYISKVAGRLYGESGMSNEEFERLVETPAGQTLRIDIDGPDDDDDDLMQLIEELAAQFFRKD